MISKPVPAHSFYHTCRYVTNKPGAEIIMAEGVRAYDFKLMAADFQMQQELRPSKERACFHSILSFYPGENPPDEVLREIVGKYLQGLGIVNTQYAVSKHTDKAHLHLHIVANMVDNEGKTIPDGWIGLRGKKIAQALTKEYKLIPALGKNLQLTHLEALSQSEATRYEIYQAITAALPHCRTLDDLEQRLRQQDIETLYKYKGQTQEKQGVSFKMGEYCFKGSQVDRQFSLAGLQKTLDRTIRQELEPGPAHQQQMAQPAGKTGRKLPIAPRQMKSELPGIILSEVTQTLAKGAADMLNELLKVEQTHDHMPYELTQKYHQRKRKKKQRGR